MLIAQILKVDCNYYTVNHQTPERLLLLAIVERAMGDLSTIVSADIRRDAIAWFKGLRKINDDCAFSFKYIADSLEFTDSEMSYIYQQVSEAIKREELRVQEALRLGANLLTFKLPGKPPQRSKRRFVHAGRKMKHDASIHA